MRFLVLVALTAASLAAADNTLTEAERQQGWKLLFDGKTFGNWRDPAQEKPAGDAWLIEDGCLTTKAHPHISEDLISTRSYKDFTLEWDWKVSPAANTGVKYRLQRIVFLNETRAPKGPGGFEGMLAREMAAATRTRESIGPEEHGQEYTVAFEFQLIDDERHPDAKKDDAHKTGALYSMLAAKSHPAHAAGEWNQSRLVLKGTHVEHWINAEQVLSTSLDNPEGLASLKTRWKNGPAVYDILAHAKLEGPISLQNHGDKVWFKNVKILEQ